MSAVALLSQWIGVGECGCPISLSTNLRMFVSLLFRNNAPALSSTADATATLMILYMVKTIAIQTNWPSFLGYSPLKIVSPTNSIQTPCFVPMSLKGMVHQNGCLTPSLMHSIVLSYLVVLPSTPVTDGLSFLFLLLLVSACLHFYVAQSTART